MTLLFTVKSTLQLTTWHWPQQTCQLGKYMVMHCIKVHHSLRYNQNEAIDQWLLHRVPADHTDRQPGKPGCYCRHKVMVQTFAEQIKKDTWLSEKNPASDATLNSGQQCTSLWGTGQANRWMRVCTWSLHTKTGIETIDRVQRSASQVVSGEYICPCGLMSMYTSQTLNSNDYSVRRHHGLVSISFPSTTDVCARWTHKYKLRASCTTCYYSIFCVSSIPPRNSLTQESVTAEVLHRAALAFVDIAKACICLSWTARFNIVLYIYCLNVVIVMPIITFLNGLSPC